MDEQHHVNISIRQILQNTMNVECSHTVEICFSAVYNKVLRRLFLKSHFQPSTYLISAQMDYLPL